MVGVLQSRRIRINCFALKRFYKQDGVEIAKNLRKIGQGDIVREFPIVKIITTDGPYINIKLNQKGGKKSNNYQAAETINIEIKNDK